MTDFSLAKSLTRAATRGIAVCSMLIAQHSLAYSELVIFGDSLSDTGVTTATAPYAEGRMSNGPIYSDYLAQSLSLSSESFRSGGSNYAVVGSTIVADGSGFSSSDMLDKYLDGTGGNADAEALYVLLAGGNDILTSHSDNDVIAAATELTSMINDLYVAGASTIIVGNVPDLLLTPYVNQLGETQQAIIQGRLDTFNASINEAVAAFGDRSVILWDVYGTTQSLAANASSFGITNTSDACLDDPNCGTADDYFWFDHLHPTSQIHLALAETAIATAVPLPPSATIFGSSLIGLLILRRRHNA